jgi:phage shock protein A
MGTFSRIRYVIAANMNALLEKAEDPEKLLRALIREMEDAGEDARMAVADLLAEQTHMERQAERLASEISEWQNRAEQAIAADRDDLARAALAAKAELVDAQEVNGRDREELKQRVAQLEADMATLKAKLGEAKNKLKDMTAPTRSASKPARKEDPLSRNERKIRNAMGRFDRLQNQVERLEARVRSYEVGGEAPSPWTASTPKDDPAIEAELKELKARISGKPQDDGTANPDPAPAKATAKSSAQATAKGTENPSRPEAASEEA